MEESQAQKRVKSRRRKASEMQRRPRQRRRDALPLQLSVTLSIPQHARTQFSQRWIAQVSTKALLMHVLYARGVCPAPAIELVRLSQNASESITKAKAKERKRMKFGASLHQLLQEWSTVSRLLDIKRAIITIGPSWSRPKEIYVLDLRNVGIDDGESNKAEPTLMQEHALSRRLVCALMNETAEQVVLARPSPAASSFQAYVSFWIQHAEAKRLLEEEEKENHAQDLAPQSLIVRHGFSLQRMQSHVITTKIISCDVENDNDVWNEQDGVWISLPTRLKGFRLQ